MSVCIMLTIREDRDCLKVDISFNDNFPNNTNSTRIVLVRPILMIFIDACAADQLNNTVMEPPPRGYHESRPC